MLISLRVGLIRLLSLLALVATAPRGFAQPIEIPNGSFEAPKTLYAGVYLTSWQEFSKPPWYDESGPFLWDQVTGAFKNTPLGSVDHILNCDGAQAAFVFAIPEAGFFQDYTSKDWDDPEPTHAFDVRFEVGRAYRLIAGIIGGGGNMLEGATLELSLYFRDLAGQTVPVATTIITNSFNLTPGRTNLADFIVNVPTVQASDAWAGRHLGIQIRSTATFELEGGYWVVDHLRLEAIPEPVLTLEFEQVGAQLRLSWPSVAGTTYQLGVSENLSAWSNFGEPQAGTGGALFELIPTTEAVPTHFRVRATAEP